MTSEGDIEKRFVKMSPSLEVIPMMIDRRRNYGPMMIPM